jgi:hypothetical protein
MEEEEDEAVKSGSQTIAETTDASDHALGDTCESTKLKQNA